MKLSKDLKEFVELLNKNGVKYLLVGGWSVSIYAKPRYTKDIDFLIFAEAENAKKMMVVLDEFGFGSVGIEIRDFTEAGQIIQLGQEPSRIDLLTSLKGIDFTDAWSRRNQVDIDGVSVNLISVEDLKKNKRAVGRPQDLADVAQLEKLSG